jgi:hypothetical protein
MGDTSDPTPVKKTYRRSWKLQSAANNTLKGDTFDAQQVSFHAIGAVFGRES